MINFDIGVVVIRFLYNIGMFHTLFSSFKKTCYITTSALLYDSYFYLASIFTKTKYRRHSD